MHPYVKPSAGVVTPAATFAAGIIAAGDGSRLKPAFPGRPKPMVAIAGRPLCGWVAGALRTAGASSITMIINTGGMAVRTTLESAFPGVAWRFFVENTASSWESFRVVAGALSEHADCVITTADALIPPDSIASFTRTMRSRRAVCGLGLTDFIDDEKPLWADLGGDGAIRALGEHCAARRYATAGLYYLTAPAVRTLPPADAYSSLRGYWTAAVSQGCVAGMTLGKTIDVDRPEDVKAAERFITETNWGGTDGNMPPRLLSSPRGRKVT